MFAKLIYYKNTFFKRYEKLIFPIAVGISISLSILLQISLETGILRVLILFIIFKIKFPVFGSSIYTAYIKELKETYERGLKPEEEFLSLQISQRITMMLLLSLLISSFLDSESVLKNMLSLISAWCAVYIIIDFLNEIKRSIMNTANLKLVPKPILDKKLVRSHWTHAYQGVKHSIVTNIVPKAYAFGGTYGPKLVSATVALLTISEKIIPDLYNPDVNIGPVTKTVMNIQFSESLEYPIKTKQDVVYESQRAGVEDGVKDGSRSYNYMPKRTFSFYSEVERTEFLAKNSIIK